MRLQWKKILVGPQASILEVLKIIDQGSVQIALIVDEGGRLLATVTDGDIRRGILRGVPLEAPVSEVMNINPTVAYSSQPHESILEEMRKKEIWQIPVINSERKVVGVRFLKELVEKSAPNNKVVLMAGGMGKRLRPLTENCPKPMLKVGDKPILETIIQDFADFGFRKFIITTHYHADMIEGYFGDGSEFDVEIEYVREVEPLGTAGALSLIADKPREPFFVMNGDLLTKLNFQRLMSFHNEHQAALTMCVQQHDIEIPFGVVKLDGHSIEGIEEKPTRRFFVNAGIYVLDPSSLSLIPKNTYLDMPELVEKLIRRDEQVAAFAVREDWMDIGRPEDFQKAQNVFIGDASEAQFIDFQPPPSRSGQL